ncbi:DUF2786 domain-containing protein [Paraphotobacterium marinum]|uniref:DUF2786 domain-containing protein n=1 Tax=Paraphotobacterium marinum TaxID=1755811 RepID=UPI0039E977C3
MSNKRKALKKIAKCLELSNSSNINEAAQAIKMAQSLMRKYGLGQDDIDFIGLGKTTSETILPSIINQSILKIIRSINRKFAVECVLINYKGLKKAEFIGVAERAIFAAFAFDIIYREMNQEIGQFKNSLSGSGNEQTVISKRVNSFLAGWIEGAIEKLPQLDTIDNYDKKMSNFIDNEFKNLDREQFKKQMAEAIATMTQDYEKGVQKGKKINIAQPVSSNQPKPKAKPKKLSNL